MFELKSKYIKILINKQNGETAAIFSAEDKYGVNYVIPDMGWGTVDGFGFESVLSTSKGITAIYNNIKEKLTLTVKKYIDSDDYIESYIIENYGERDYFLTRDNFGINLPFSSNYQSGTNIIQNNTINHIWCGGDSV